MAETVERALQPARRFPWRRAALHASLLAAFFAISGAVLIWPQWVAVDGSRLALSILRERDLELSDRLTTVRAMNSRLSEWERSGRKVFTQEELAGYDRLVRTAAKRHGAKVLRTRLLPRPPAKWRTVSVPVGSGAGAAAEEGEVQPRSVSVVLTGSFDSLYRTVVTLCGQQQLFLPERWDVATLARGKEEPLLRVSLVATVFAVREPGSEPAPVVAPVPRSPDQPPVSAPMSAVAATPNPEELR